VRDYYGSDSLEFIKTINFDKDGHKYGKLSKNMPQEILLCLVRLYVIGHD